MASFNGSAFQGSTHSHSHQRSHRKVPNRLPLDGTTSNYSTLDGNAFLDHPGDDNVYESNGFMTPATSRFPSQDMNGLLIHNNSDPNHNGHSHSHTHSHSHLPAHSHSNSDLYGRGKPTVHDYTPVLTAQPMFDAPYTHSKITSAVLSILIALPFVLSSLVQVSPFELAESVKELDGGGLRWKARMQSRYLSFLGVCSLTAATLVTVGFVGELQAATNKTSNKSQRSVRDGIISLASLKEMVERILSIGLPLYATSKLGGERVAIVVLMACAAELTSKNLHTSHDSMAGIWNMVKYRKWTFGAFLLQLSADVVNLTTPSLPMQTLSGYLALFISVLILPWPFPASVSSMLNGHADKGSRRNSNSSTWEVLGTSLPRSALISSSHATDITVASGVLATIISFVVFVLSSQETQTLTLPLLLGGSTVAIFSAVSLLFADSRALLSSHSSMSLASALGSSLFIQEIIDPHPVLPIFFQLLLILASWTCVCLDVKREQQNSHDHDSQQSWATRLILRQVEDIPLLHKIFSKKDSRRIVYFMFMNFSFMFVQGIWGYLTGSLGLLSDTVHMFFDCAALLVGLVATLLSEKQPNLAYPYGYAKVDALAGFGNGVLLLAISVEMVYEALDRIASGSQLNRLGELLIVSTGGLLVNIFGLFAFGHHGHSHGHDHDHGHAHGHSHSNGHIHDHSHVHNHNHSHSKDCQHSHDYTHDNKANHNHSNSSYYDATSYVNGGLLYSPAQGSPSPATTPRTPALIQQDATTPKHNHLEHNHSLGNSHSHAHNHSHGHSHGHTHGHSHEGGSNMHGIYLHILADMMGSVSVMISTVLVHYTGWAGWDALASVAISYFIIMATIPLVKSTAKELVLDIPETQEFDLREALSGIGQLRGVVNITAPRFWLESNQTSGVMHIVAGKGADLDDVRERAVSYLKGKNMDVLVQVEREGEGRCWCGSANATTTRAS